MTDFRALCAELLADYEDSFVVGQPGDDPLVQRARAALAQPEPQGPTVMEIIELHDWLEAEWQANNDGEDLPVLDFARAVLARWGNQ
jgi:hypothetical protein